MAVDLGSDTVADYNWITPNQYNDMHTSLKGGYNGLTGDAGSRLLQMMEVIRNPEMTKKISTPTYPPAKAGIPAWKPITDRTAIARNPSMSGR